MPVPRVSILLLNWNRWRDTIECLESILRLEYSNWNVVLCDNASTDDSVGRIREWAAGKTRVTFSVPRELHKLVDPPVAKPVTLTMLSIGEALSGLGVQAKRSLIVIRNRRNDGFAAGNNIGLRHIQRVGAARYVWILNNDTVVAPDALSKLIACAEASGKVGAVGATIYEYSEPRTVQFAAGGDFGPWRSFGTAPREVGTRLAPDGALEADVDYITGSSLLIPVETIARVGLIAEEYFMYGEDVDYSLRIRRAGLHLLHAADAHVWHKGGASIGHRTPPHDYYAVRNALHLVSKYYPRMIPATLAYLAYRVVLPKVARRQWDRLLVVQRAYRDYARGIFGPAPADSIPIAS